jgi:hypothetical protein
MGARFMLERPRAALPLTIEGLLFAGLILLGVLPADGGVAPAAAIFPFDLYFDLKQSIAFSSSWAAFGVSLAALVAFRSALLALTVTLSDGRRRATANLRDALKLGVVGAVFLFPAATLYFVAVAIRYAPFAWIAGALGLLAGWRLCRRGVVLGLSARSSGVPEFPSFFLYGCALMGLGAGITVLSDRSTILAAVLVGCAGPFHAAVWLGWRRRAMEGATSSEGRAVATLAFLLVAAFFVTAIVDRNLRDYDVVPADYEGTLLLVGGADSTSKTGALTGLDPGALGYSRAQTEMLSYAPDGGDYQAADTRRDLDRVAETMAVQIEEATEPAVLLGHSQASLILDRTPDLGDSGLGAAAVVAPSVPEPPSVEVPPPGDDGEGRVGGDLARAFSDILQEVGLSPYDVDGPASPTNLDSVDPAPGARRLSLWALGDSILLEDDWRRPGETNLVVLSDHVGATRNPRALDAARLFLQGKDVGSDEASWRSLPVNVFRYAFEPFRPSR